MRDTIMVGLASGLACLILVLSGVVQDAVDGAAVVGTVLVASGATVLRYTP